MAFTVETPEWHLEPDCSSPPKTVALEATPGPSEARTDAVAAAQSQPVRACWRTLLHSQTAVPAAFLLTHALVLPLFFYMPLLGVILLAMLACTGAVAMCAAVLTAARADELQVRKAQALEEQRQRHEVAAQMKDTLLQVAAHDLRSPLCCILSVAELRRAQCEAGGTQQGDSARAWRQIEDSAQHMHQILAGLLHLQRLQQSEATVATRMCQAEDVLQESVKRFQPQALRKGLEVSIAEAEAPVLLRAEPVCVQQAVDNYLSNAIKYSPYGGRVTLSARRTGPWITICVEDSGCGVPKEQRVKLFTDFACISNLPTDGEPSVGLGLAIVKRLIEGQGGQVGAEFPERGGARFWLRLPLASPGRAAAFVKGT